MSLYSFHTVLYNVMERSMLVDIAIVVNHIYVSVVEWSLCWSYHICHFSSSVFTSWTLVAFDPLLCIRGVKLLYGWVATRVIRLWSPISDFWRVTEDFVWQRLSSKFFRLGVVLLFCWLSKEQTEALTLCLYNGRGGKLIFRVFRAKWNLGWRHDCVGPCECGQQNPLGKNSFVTKILWGRI